MPRHFIGPGDGPTAKVPDEESFGEIIDAVDALDLSPFENAYRADGSGGQPFDPRLVVVAMAWGYRHGQRSPSELTQMCQSQVLLRN